MPHSVFFEFHSPPQAKLVRSGCYPDRGASGPTWRGPSYAGFLFADKLGLKWLFNREIAGNAERI
jgi:hypothetical protein